MGKPLDLTVHSFAGGVLSAVLDARSDTERYFISARKLNNVFVMRSGAAANRSGFEYLGTVKDSTKPPRLAEWSFDDDDRYIMELGDFYIRLWQDGGRIVTDGLTAQWDITKFYNVGDLVRETDSGVTLVYYCCIAQVGTPPLVPTNPVTWLALEGVVTTPAADAAGIFEIPSPYRTTEVFDVRFAQSGDVTWCAHPTHPPYELRRTAATTWTMKAIDFAPPIDGPLNLAATKGGTGTGTIDAYKVTAVKRDTFEESLPGGVAATTNSTGTITGGSGSDVRITSTAYGISNGTTIICIRVYPLTGSLNPTFEAALLNKAFTLSVVTANTFDLSGTTGITVPAGYAADFVALSSTLDSGTTTGTAADDALIGATAHGLTTGDEILIVFATSTTTAEAFAAIVGKTYTVSVVGANSFHLDNSDGINWTTDVGTIYFTATAVTINHGTTSPTVNLTWDVVPEAEKYYVYRKSNGVFGYVATVTEVDATSGLVTWSDPNVTSVVGDGADTSDTPPRYYNPFRGTDKFPAAVGLHDQRLAFAATNEKPADFWMSKVGDFLNFTHSSPFKDDDSITGTIVGAQELRHLLTIGDALVAMSNHAFYFIEGDADGTLIPQQVRAKLRGRVGSAGVTPIVIDDAALFVQSRCATVRDFRSDLVEFQKGRDLTTYAPALVDGFSLTQWAYQRLPHSILWAVRSDGILIANTYVREQEIAAWHTHDTGKSFYTGDDAGFESVAVESGPDGDALYAVVNRTINPVYKYAAKYEPPDGYVMMGLGYFAADNLAIRALHQNSIHAFIPSTADATTASGSGNVQVNSFLPAVENGDSVVCTNVWVANADGFIGTALNGVMTGATQPNGVFRDALLGQTFTVTGKASQHFELASTSGITVPATHRPVFIKAGNIVSAPATAGAILNIGATSASHGEPAYGAPGTTILNKALSGGAGVNITITSATTYPVGSWIEIIDVDPSAGAPDLVFEALLEGHFYLVATENAGVSFTLAGTSGITVPATQQADFRRRGTLPSWPGTLGTAYFDKALSGGAGAGVGGANLNILVTTATPPASGTKILVVDVTKTAGAVQATFEATLEAKVFTAINVVAGVSFQLQGTSTITVPASQIMDFTVVTGDINYWSMTLSEAEILADLQASDANGQLAQMHATLIDQVQFPNVGVDTIIADAAPADQYAGILAQLAALGVALGKYNKPVMLLFAGEANLVSQGYHRDDFPAAFAAARLYVRSIANAQTASSFNKVATCWSVLPSPTVTDWSLWYPGDASVDWIGIDPFDAAEFQEGTPKNLSLVSLLEFAEGRNKPVFFGETVAAGSQIPDLLPDEDNGGEDDDLAEASAANMWRIWMGPWLDFLARYPIVKMVRYLGYDYSFTGYAGSPTFWLNAYLGSNKFFLAKWLAFVREGHWLTADGLSLLKDWRTNQGLSAETTGPTTVRNIERMRPRKAGEETDYDESLDSFFVDSGLTWDGRNSEHPEWLHPIIDPALDITLTLTGGSTYLAGTSATLATNAHLALFTSAAVDVGLTGYRLTDPVTGDTVEVFVTGFTSTSQVTVEFQQDCTDRLAAGIAATVWTKMVRTYTGLSRLEGRILNVLGDGIRQPTVAVANGAVFFQKPLGIIQFGIYISAEIETLDLDVPDGKIAGKMVRPAEVTAIVHRTRGAKFGPSDGGVLVPMRETPVLTSDPVALFSGKATCKMRSSSKLKSSIVIRQTDPLPMLVEGLYPRAEV